MPTSIEIIVSVCGGVVQDVFCSRADARLTVVDWDTEGASPDNPGIVEVKSAEGKDYLAHVDCSRPAPFADFAGTEVELALKAAKVPIDHEPIARRFLLYDFDAGELATAQLYSDRAEACRDADELDNVMVLVVPIPGPTNGE